MAHDDAAGKVQAGAPQEDLESLLRQVLTAVREDKRRSRLEICLAIVMSLATLASTWCGFQATLWGSAQGKRENAADIAGRKAAEQTIVAMQIRTFDGIEILALWDAIRHGDVDSQRILRARLRPELAAAVEASLAAGVLHDPKAAGPLQRPEYSLPEERDALKYRADEERLDGEAREAGRNSGAYVMLTLVFASVLFFGGVATSFTARGVRIGLGGMSLALLMVCLAMMARLPMCPP